MEVNKIYNMDCIDGLKQLEANSIDLVITSPPYDDLRNYKGYQFNPNQIIKELYRVIKDRSVVVWIVGDATINGTETGTSFKQALSFKEEGFNIHDTMIYQKNNPMPQFKSKRYTGAFEYMFIFSKGIPKTCNYLEEPCIHIGNIQSGKRRTASGIDSVHKDKDPRITKETKIRTNIWRYNVGINQSYTDKFASMHPAIFPEKLAEDHILSWSNKGDLILDPMCGSGTTCKMALINKRNYIGMDISKEYCEIAEQRLKELEQQRQLAPIPPTDKSVGILGVS